MSSIWIWCLLLSYYAEDVVPAPDRSTTEEDYQGYLRAQEVFRLAFDFSTEETVIHPKINPELTFGWDNTSWVMGVKGRDLWGKWYTKAECMAVLVLPNVAMMPCACMWSWYRSFRSGQIFEPAPDRTPLDITTAELYLYHTLHEGSDYFRDEETRYYTVRNEVLDSPECSAAIDPNAGPTNKPDWFKQNEQKNSWGLVELETPVYVDSSPVNIPKIYVKDDYSDESDVRKIWKLALLLYGTSFADDNMLFVPPYANEDYKKKNERWRAWSNSGRLKTEMVAIVVKPRRGSCRDEYDWKGDYRGERECWRTSELQTQICNVLPGAPIVHEQGFVLYGIIMNRTPCPIVGKETFFEVRRFTNVKKDVLQELLAPYEEKLRHHQEVEANRKRLQRLFNQTLSEINYDEDIDPVFRFKIRNNISVNPEPLSQRSKASTIHRPQLSLLGVLIVRIVSFSITLTF